MENINEQFKRLFCELDLTDDQAAMIKKLQRDVNAALHQPPVSGSLPTDKEIEKQAELKFPVKTHKTPDLSPNVLKKVIFINACKWMRKNWQ